jgi:bifunctional DNA-binding transcriptional regulator/antitoxin component of YhaV-PrlF toxin-antitoxin module
MGKTIQVNQQGAFTLPAKLREKYDIRSGDTFQLIDLDGIFVLTPTLSEVSELAREIEQMRQDAGSTTQELISGLREQRTAFFTEKYGE